MSYKVIRVSGEMDFSALNFEEKFPKEEWESIWKKAMQNEDHTLELLEVFDEEHDEDAINIEAYEFKNRPDEEFIALMRDLEDYDMTKHENWFEV